MVAEEMKRRYRFLIAAIVIFLAAAVLVELRPAGGSSSGPFIQFWGAARRVGGSCILVENGGTRFIIDCGALGEEGSGALPPEPDSLAFAILTHAHIDHCGLLADLVRAGFEGRVYCTEGTAKLVPIMLGMMRGIADEKIGRDAYERAIASLVPVAFGKTVAERGVSFVFRRAEHLLGAAFVELRLPSRGDTVRLVLSGDIGGGNAELLRPLETPGRADYVVMESTYGGVIRDSSSAVPRDGHAEFAEAVGAALRGGGDVLVPAFTLGRTQEAMAVVDRFERSGVIPPGTEVYVDSPTAHRITDVYRERRDDLSTRSRELYPGDALRFPALREVRSKTALRVHARRHRPTIFISSSGDLDHANSPRHFMRMFDDARNLLCTIGWQAPGSLGARLQAGESPVLVRHLEGKKMREDWVAPALSVLSFHSFSAHADAAGLLAWLGAAKGVAEVFLVHGEEENCLSLAELIRNRLGLRVEVPRRGERFALSPRRKPAIAVTPAPAPGPVDTSAGAPAPAGDPFHEED